MRLSDYCRNDCGKPKEPMFSFIVGVVRYNFCSDGCLQSKLEQLKCAEVV